MRWGKTKEQTLRDVRGGERRRQRREERRGDMRGDMERQDETRREDEAMRDHMTQIQTT